MNQILKTIGPTFLNLKEIGFLYGIQGSILRRNLERYWFLQCVTLSKYNTFYLHSKTLEMTLKDLSEIGLDRVPFGIAEIDEVKNKWNDSFFPPSSLIRHKIAKVTTVYESDGDILSVKDLFYEKLRERKSWWCKISENPSIYNRSEVKKGKNKEYAEIQAQFPFGTIVVETINYYNANKFLSMGNNNPEYKTVEHVTSLDWGTLAILCDGYTEIDNSKELQIHPKLSPYKAYCKAIINPEDDEKTKQELSDLTLYVIELLREEGVESVIVNDIKCPEIFQVPYIINVDNDSLKTGLLKVVSQRTLCGEIVHITYLAKHMYDLCV